MAGNVTDLVFILLHVSRMDERELAVNFPWWQHMERAGGPFTSGLCAIQKWTENFYIWDNKLYAEKQFEFELKLIKML